MAVTAIIIGCGAIDVILGGPSGEGVALAAFILGPDIFSDNDQNNLEDENLY